MAKVHFHFRLGPNDAAPLAPDGNEVLFEVPLRPNQHDLGHGLHGALQSLARMGLAPSELGIDFLILGTAVITADKHVSRQSQAGILGHANWPSEFR